MKFIFTFCFLIAFLNDILSQVKNPDFYNLFFSDSVKPEKQIIAQNKIKKSKTFVHYWYINKIDEQGNLIMIEEFDKEGNIIIRKKITYNPYTVLDTTIFNYLYLDNYKKVEIWQRLPDGSNKIVNSGIYDENGNITEETIYDYRINVIRYKYNEKNILISKTEADKSYIYECDERGNIIKWTYYIDSRIFGIEKYYYDDKNNLITRCSVDNDNSVQYVISTFTYNANISAIEQFDYSYEPWKVQRDSIEKSKINVVTNKVIYEYDSFKRLSKKQLFVKNHDNNFILTEEYLYQFDQSGMLTEFTEDKKLNYKTTFKIKYEHFD